MGGFCHCSSAYSPMPPFNISIHLDGLLKHPSSYSEPLALIISGPSRSFQWPARHAQPTPHDRLPRRLGRGHGIAEGAGHR